MEQEKKTDAYFGFNSGATTLSRRQKKQGVQMLLQDQASNCVRTDVGIFNYAQWLIQNATYIDVAHNIRYGQDPCKQQILNDIREHLQKQESWCNIYIHYSGHGTVTPKNIIVSAMDAGKWCCSENEYITIEELLKTVDESLVEYNLFLLVSISADCCGAAGAYHRLLHKLYTEELKLKRKRYITIHASAEYWQKSFAGERGGLMTELATTQKLENDFKKTTQTTIVKGIECRLELKLHKDTIRNDP